MTAPIRSMAEPHELIAVVRTHEDITELFRMMKERLGLTNGFCDDVGKMVDGHTDKILGPTQTKNWGPLVFDKFMELFAIEFHARVNMHAVKRMEAVWEGRERPLYPNAKVKRISKKLIERAKPYVYRDSGRSGGLKRAASLPAKLRSKIARKGGKSRMKRITESERKAMAAKGWETRRSRIIALTEPCATPLLEQRPDLPALECLAPNA